MGEIRPIPYHESNIKNRFWEKDPDDKLLPSPGFITDFVLATRGIETPTLFSMWVGFFMISSVLKRSAHLKWFPTKLYPNLYVFIVAPPRTCGKSTATRLGTNIMSNYHQYLKNGKFVAEKELTIKRSRITNESLIDNMEPTQVPFKDQRTGSAGFVQRDSHIVMAISELATSLGKQKYNTGLIEKLTDLYDCADLDTDDTITRGAKILQNIYVTLIGATTETGLKDSIPEAAFGDGFLSRVNIVFKTSTSRNFPKPLKVEGGPDIEELQRRLAWIAENAVGEYYLNEEAFSYYEEWYCKKFKPGLSAAYGTAKFRPRADNHLLKLALIIRAQRFEKGFEINLNDLKQAINIITYTDKTGTRATESVGKSFYTEKVMRIQSYIENQKEVTRRKLFTTMTQHNFTSDMLTKAISHLYETGQIRILLDGKDKEHPSTKGKEVYKWCGK